MKRTIKLLFVLAAILAARPSFAVLMQSVNTVSGVTNATATFALGVPEQGTFTRIVATTGANVTNAVVSLVDVDGTSLISSLGTLTASTYPVTNFYYSTTQTGGTSTITTNTIFTNIINQATAASATWTGSVKHGSYKIQTASVFPLTWTTPAYTNIVTAYTNITAQILSVFKAQTNVFLGVTNITAATTNVLVAASTNIVGAVTNVTPATTTTAAPLINLSVLDDK